jgi:tetratricopeptide (TPR) repeat protein
VKKKLLYRLCLISAFSILSITVYGKASLSAGIDSLKQKLLTSLPDTSRIQVLNSLADKTQSIDAFIALDYAKEALQLSEKNNYRMGKGISLGIMGSIHERLFNYRESLFCYLQALRIFEEINNVWLQSVTLNYIGSIYMWIDKYDEAQKYYIQSMKLSIQAGRKGHSAIFYNNLGIIAYKTGRMNEAIAYYNKSIEAAKILDKKDLIGHSALNLGELYCDLKQPKLAETYLKQGLANSYNIRDSITAFSGLGKLYADNRQYKLAEAYFLKTELLGNRTGIETVLKDTYKSMADMYLERGNYQKAYIYKELYHTLQDSVLNNTVTRKMNDLQARYDVEKKDKEIQLLSQGRQIIEAQVHNQQLLRDFIIVFFVLIIVIGIIVTRNMILKQSVKNKVLNEKNILIENDNTKLLRENTEAKYEVLKSKTNPHFLFNSFTNLSSLIIKNQRSAIEYIEHFSELYRMILKSGDTKLVPLKEEMQLVNHYIYIQQMWHKEDLQIDIEDFNDKQYLVPSFAIQMLVENAVKHNVVSREQPLCISIYTEDETIVVKNNLQKKMTRDLPSTAIGQKNIIERYRLISDRQPEFIESATTYIAKLPLLPVYSEITI